MEFACWLETRLNLTSEQIFLNDRWIVGGEVTHYSHNANKGVSARAGHPHNCPRQRATDAESMMKIYSVIFAQIQQMQIKAC